mgnify:CR=1 FL=1
MIPGEFCHLTSLEELGAHCFHYTAPGFMGRVQAGADIVVAGEGWGSGSSREQAVWALKGAGVKAVIAQSFERIHRSNLVGMGIVPFVLEEGTSWQSLGLKGDETVTIEGLETVKPRQKVIAKITYADGETKDVPLICRVDTADEIGYLNNGGILQTVLRDLAA